MPGSQLPARRHVSAPRGTLEGAHRPAARGRDARGSRAGAPAPWARKTRLAGWANRAAPVRPGKQPGFCSGAQEAPADAWLPAAVQAGQGTEERGQGSNPHPHGY